MSEKTADEWLDIKLIPHDGSFTTSVVSEVYVRGEAPKAIENGYALLNLYEPHVLSRKDCVNAAKCALAERWLSDEKERLREAEERAREQKEWLDRVEATVQKIKIEFGKKNA